MATDENKKTVIEDLSKSAETRLNDLSKKARGGLEGLTQSAEKSLKDLQKSTSLTDTNPPSTSPPSPQSKGSLGIRLTPSGDTPEINRETAGTEVLDFQNDVAGSVHRLSQDVNEEYGPQKAAALDLYSRGATSTKVAAAVRESKILSPQTEAFLKDTANIIGGFEKMQQERAGELLIAAGYPTIELFKPTETEVAEYYEQLPDTAQYQYVFYDKSDDGLSLAAAPAGAYQTPTVSNTTFNQMRGLSRQAFDRGFGKIRKIKGKVGKKFKKEIGKKAAKAVVKTGIKTGAKATVAAGSGGTSLLIEAGLKVLGALKKGAGKLLSILTGEEDERKALTKAAFAAGAGALLLGATGAAVGLFAVAGLGAVSTFGIAGAAGGMAMTIGLGFLGIAAAFLGAILIPILITFAAFVLLTIFILIIINNSAYVTPQGGLNVAPPGSYESPYVRVEKRASAPGHDASSYLVIENNELPLTVTYTITVTARGDTLTNIGFVYECNTVREGVDPPCPDAPSLPSPQTISPAEPFVFEYEMDYSNTSFSNTLVFDTFTVTADVPDQTSTQAVASATIAIGTPPISCPLPGRTIDPFHGSYFNGEESGGHGSNNYWGRMGGTACRWGLPQGVCNGPSNLAASSNVCYDSENGCEFYGYAADVFSTPNAPVIAPIVEGDPATWVCEYAFANGLNGHTFRCTSGQHTLILTHLNINANTGVVNSGEQIGTLFNQGGNTHVHIEYAINGLYQRPENYFCF